MLDYIFAGAISAFIAMVIEANILTKKYGTKRELERKIKEAEEKLAKLKNKNRG